MTFETLAHRRIYEKVGCYLAEMGAPAIATESGIPRYIVDQGSVRVSVTVTAAGDNNAFVMVASMVVAGAPTDDGELQQFLLKANESLLFGGFAMDAEGAVVLYHTLVGSSCTRASLRAALVGVATSADEYDDQITARWGGTRALEPPPEVVAPEGDSRKGRREAKPPPEVEVHKPAKRGIGDGRAVFLLFGLKAGHAVDQRMLAGELEHLQDDIATLREAGYTVVVHREATAKTLLAALASKSPRARGLATAAVYWSGHGEADGSLETSDGGRFRPEDLAGRDVSPSLRMMVFSSCYVGQRARAWRKALGGNALVVGWGRPVSAERALAFLDPNEASGTDLDDLIRRYLLTDTPVPPEISVADFTPADSLRTTGALGDLASTLAEVAEMLGAMMRVRENYVELTVPLEDGRAQRADVCVVESAEPFAEGEQLIAAQSDVGEMEGVVDAAVLLASIGRPGFARVVAVRGDGDVPRIVLQGFLPRTRVRSNDVAAMLYEVCRRADALERRVFGTNQP